MIEVTKDFYFEAIDWIQESYGETQFFLTGEGRRLELRTKEFDKLSVLAYRLEGDKDDTYFVAHDAYKNYMDVTMVFNRRDLIRKLDSMDITDEGQVRFAQKVLRNLVGKHGGYKAWYLMVESPFLYMLKDTPEYVIERGVEAMVNATSGFGEDKGVADVEIVQ